MDFHFYWSQSRDVYDWLVFGCSLALVIVGAWGVMGAVVTLRKIERQTKATEDAATAARLNAQSLITSERPWLVGHIIQDAIMEFTEHMPIKFLCEIKNEGKTPAILMDAGAKALLNQDGVLLPEEPDYGRPDPLNDRMLLPGATYFYWVLAEGYEWKDGLWYSLEKNKSGKIRDLMVGFGCIRYRDTFGETEEHITRFCEYAQTGSKLAILYDKSPMPPVRSLQVNGPFLPWDLAPPQYTQCT